MIQILHACPSPTDSDAAQPPPAAPAAHALLDLVAARDRATLTHSHAVAGLSVAIAIDLGLAHARIQRLRMAALLHDVGKLVVPDAVLLKPGPLTQAEHELVEQHAVWGERIARAIGLATEALWILHHHERPDGRGYPHGLCGREIPIESRILHVADAFDALTSDRPYRRAETRRHALEVIVDGAGTDFDPECVAALTAVAARPPGISSPIARFARA